jgi:hypothetical protein
MAARVYRWVLSAYVLLLVAWTWYSVSDPGCGAGQVANALPEEESRAAETHGGATKGLALRSVMRQESRRSRRLLYEANWLTLVSPRGAGTAVKWGYFWPTLLEVDKVRAELPSLHLHIWEVLQSACRRWLRRRNRDQTGWCVAERITRVGGG